MRMNHCSLGEIYSFAARMISEKLTKKFAEVISEVQEHFTKMRTYQNLADQWVDFCFRVANGTKSKLMPTKWSMYGVDLNTLKLDQEWGGFNLA